MPVLRDHHFSQRTELPALLVPRVALVRLTARRDATIEPTIAEPIDKISAVSNRPQSNSPRLSSMRMSPSASAYSNAYLLRAVSMLCSVSSPAAVHQKLKISAKDSQTRRAGIKELHRVLCLHPASLDDGYSFRSHSVRIPPNDFHNKSSHKELHLIIWAAGKNKVAL